MPEKSQRKFGPVTLGVAFFGTAFGVVAVLVQRHLFSGNWGRLIIGTGVVVGAFLGIVIGVLWEAHFIPRPNMANVARDSRLVARVLILFALVSLPLVIYQAFVTLGMITIVFIAFVVSVFMENRHKNGNRTDDVTRSERSSNKKC